jgi:uncharacterized cupredoxin-like copper-binding protein
MMRILLVLLVASAASAYAHPHHGDPIAGHETQHSPPPEERAFGRPGDAARIARTLSVVMDDGGRCSPAAFSVKQGETVKIVARNAGRQPQEVAIGTVAELNEHAAMFRKFPGMQASLAHRSRAAAGATAELVWQFTQPGEFRVACAPIGQFAPEATARVTVRP